MFLCLEIKSAGFVLLLNSLLFDHILSLNGLLLWLRWYIFACNAGDLGLIPGLGRFSGEGNGYPLQYSCLGNSMDRGVWQATGHGVTKSQIRLSNWHFQHEQHWLWIALYSLLSLFPPERNGDAIKQDGLFETEILALLLTSYISLDKLL